MTKFEVFDDDVADDDVVVPEIGEEEVVEAPVIPTHPLGVFSREFAGRTVWFHGMSPSQLMAARRLYESTQAKIRKLDGDKRARIIFDFNNSSLALVESLILDEKDVDHLHNCLLTGEVEVDDVLEVVWPSRTRDDDEDPEPSAPVRKPRAAKTVKSKTTANARRTKR